MTAGEAGFDEIAFYREIAQEIRARRLSFGMTQKELAAVSGITQKAVNFLERGSCESMATLHKVCVALGLSSSALLRRATEKSRT